MHRFSVKIPHNWDIRKTLQKVAKNCDTFAGNEEKGTFSKSGVKGEYYITGYICCIHITDKPWLSSFQNVENRIRSFFAA